MTHSIAYPLAFVIVAGAGAQEHYHRGGEKLGTVTFAVIDRRDPSRGTCGRENRARAVKPVHLMRSEVARL